MISPVIPLLLVLLCRWEFIPAFIAGIVFCVLITWKRNSINTLTRSIIDGVTSVIPAVVLMIGIGMLIAAVSSGSVTQAMAPILQSSVPTHALLYIAVFTCLAPLALYRGPLSLWGMGSGLVAIIQKATVLSSQAIMSMLMSVGQVQGICDPTNTANIWIATYLGTDTQVLMRKTLPYAWVGVVAGLTLAVWFGYVPW
jgi:Na+/H+ antiporter NhaC